MNLSVFQVFIFQENRVTLVLPEGVVTPLTPQPVPPPLLAPLDNAPIAVKIVAPTTQSTLKTAVEQMFGDRSPAQISTGGDRETTPEREVDGKLTELNITLNLKRNNLYLYKNYFRCKLGC